MKRSLLAFGLLLIGLDASASCDTDAILGNVVPGQRITVYSGSVEQLYRVCIEGASKNTCTVAVILEKAPSVRLSSMGKEVPGCSCADVLNKKIQVLVTASPSCENPQGKISYKNLNSR